MPQNPSPEKGQNCALFLTFFHAPEKKKFSFFSCGATPSRTVPKTQPLEVDFSLRERVDLRSQKEGILGEKIAQGRVGQTGQKKEKRMHKKRWGSFHRSHREISTRNRPLSETKFLDDFWGPFLSRSLWFTADIFKQTLEPHPRAGPKHLRCNFI